MNQVVEILMKRDGMSKKEAVDLVQDVRSMMNDAIATGDYCEAEEIMYSELGLEMDYIYDILF